MNNSYASKTPTSCSTCRVLAPDELQAAVLAPCPGGPLLIRTTRTRSLGKSFTFLEVCDFQNQTKDCQKRKPFPHPFLQNSSVTTLGPSFPGSQFLAAQTAPFQACNFGLPAQLSHAIRVPLSSP